MKDAIEIAEERMQRIAALSQHVPGGESVPELLDVKQVATLIMGCSPRHVFRLAKTKTMPGPVRLGALVRWSRTALLKWISDGCPAVGGER
jgi:predicted DNA-binding transcriptional regulator AlpA